MLLREIIPEGEVELDLAWLDADESGAYRVHRALTRKAGAHSRVVRRVARLERDRSRHGHYGHTCRCDRPVDHTTLERTRPSGEMETVKMPCRGARRDA